MSTGDDVIDEALAGGPAPLYLISGEEFLVRKTADELVKRLVPGASVGLNLALMDGASPREIAQELATMPLFPGPKVVLVKDPEFLAPKKGKEDALARARDAWKANRRKEAARRILAIAARAGWGVNELDPSASGAPSREAWEEELNVQLGEADVQFLSEVAAFCREEGITAPESDVTALVDLFEKGVPPGHALVLASTEVDAKNPLVAIAKKRGKHLQREVARTGKGWGGSYKNLDLREAVDEFLRGTGKRLDPKAEAELKERVGGNMRTLQSELEKLAAYAERPTITVEDVKLLVSHSREDEFGELQDAIKERNLTAALAVVREAIAQEKHGLQLLPGVASAFRQLLEGRERVAQFVKGPFRMSSREFEAKIFPHIEREAKAAGRKVPHPYAAYKAAEAAGKYERGELIDALIACADADLQLKSGGDSKLVLEALLVHGVASKRSSAR